MPPLYFAGRDEELRKYDDDLRVLCATGESNGLQLTIGAPGSGKTRLAEEFAKRVQGQAVEGRSARTLMISPEEGDPLSLFKTVGPALADASHGFPQHINGYLEGAHQALTRCGHLEGEALKEALRHGGRRRIAYYNKRLSAAHSRKPMTALAAAMERRQRTRLEYHDAKDVLIEAGFGAAELDAAIAHGALTCDDEDNVSFGIPSFHAYMKNLLGS